MLCKKGLHSDDFRVDNRGKRYCRPCGIDATRRWQARNQEDYRDRQREYKSEHRDKMAAQFADYRTEDFHVRLAEIRTK